MLQSSDCTIGGRSSSEWISHQIERLRDLDNVHEVTVSTRYDMRTIYTFLIDMVRKNKLTSELFILMRDDYQIYYLLDKLETDIRSICFSEYIEAYLEEYSIPGTVNERLRSLGQKICEDYVESDEIEKTILSNNRTRKSLDSIALMRIKVKKYENNYSQLYLIALDRYRNINMPTSEFLNDRHIKNSIRSVTVNLPNGKSIGLTYDTKKIKDEFV